MGLFTWLTGKNKKKNIGKGEKIISNIFTPQKIFQLETIIGCPINDREIFIEALTHRSFLEHNAEIETSNERLEFLGDSVLSLVVADYLFERHPEKNEGFLTKVRAKLVNRNTLADASEKINLSDYLLVSKNLSEAGNGTKTILSDAFEAIIGAIYLDSGIEAANKFINRVLIEPVAKDGLHLKDENYKSQLLEYAQANKLPNPVYEVVKEEGPQHNRVFTIKVIIGTHYMGTGKGRNKKSAEQKAAQSALKRVKENLNKY